MCKRLYKLCHSLIMSQFLILACYRNSLDSDLWQIHENVRNNFYYIGQVEQYIPNKMLDHITEITYQCMKGIKIKWGYTYFTTWGYRISEIMHKITSKAISFPHHWWHRNLTTCKLWSGFALLQCFCIKVCNFLLCFQSYRFL